LVTARIDDDDPGYGSDAWTQYDARSGQAKPLRADRWHRTPPEEVIDGDDVSGIRSQMWMRAMKRTLMTHRLSGGGTHNVGYDALRWENMLHGDCGEYGRYHELSVLPDKIARYLFEFDSDSYASLHLPEIPEDRSQVDIHALMNPPQVLHRLHFMHILLFYAYMAFINILCIFLITMTYFAYLCICSGPSSLGHSAVAAICKKCRTSEDVFYTSDRAQKISRGAACLLLALQGQAASKVQPSGYGHGSATWHRQRCFPAEDRQCLVLQGVVPFLLCFTKRSCKETT